MMQFIHEVSFLIDTIKSESSQEDSSKRQRSKTLFDLLKKFGCEIKGSDTKILRNFVTDHLEDFLQYDPDSFRIKLEILKSLLDALHPNQNVKKVIICQYAKLFKETNATKEYLNIVKDVMKYSGKEVKERKKRRINPLKRMSKLNIALSKIKDEVRLLSDAYNLERDLSVTRS